MPVRINVSFYVKNMKSMVICSDIIIAVAMLISVSVLMR